MSMSAVPPSNAIVDLSRTFGQTFISTLLNTALWGMACSQTLMYFMQYGADAWYFKALVIILMLLSTLGEILYIKALWGYLIRNFGDIEHTTIILPELLIPVSLKALISGLAQMFFTWRIWRFSRKNWMFPTLVLPAVIWKIVGNIMYPVKGIGQAEKVLAMKSLKAIAWGVNAVDVVVDVAISISMCTVLWRSRSGLKSSNQMVLRLINASVSTGACTAICALWSCIGLLIWPNYLFFTLGEIICAMYCNTVLANLNSRRYLRGSEIMASLPNIHQTSSSLQFSTLCQSHQTNDEETLVARSETGTENCEVGVLKTSHTHYEKG